MTNQQNAPREAYVCTCGVLVPRGIGHTCKRENGLAREARQELIRELVEWKDAGAPVECVIDAIEGLIAAKLHERLADEPVMDCLSRTTLTAEETQRIGEHYAPAIREVLDSLPPDEPS